MIGCCYIFHSLFVQRNVLIFFGCIVIVQLQWKFVQFNQLPMEQVGYKGAFNVILHVLKDKKIIPPLLLRHRSWVAWLPLQHLNCWECFYQLQEGKRIKKTTLGFEQLFHNNHVNLKYKCWSNDIKEDVETFNYNFSRVEPGRALLCWETKCMLMFRAPL